MSDRSIPVLALLGALGLAVQACDTGSGPPEPTVFHFPIEGEAYEDWYYGALPNHGQSWGDTEDYACGVKTRTFHHTTDFLVPSLREMDEGVNVLAAAAGEVVGLRDGQPDRWLFYRDGREGNQVRIEHDDGLRSIYRNLKSNSIPVDRGDRVEAGQVIGQVGSSGHSNWPRVGFEARNRDGDAFDPWAGPCSGPGSYWVDQPEYPDHLAVVDAGTTDRPPTLPWIATRPPDVTSFEQGKGVGFWVHIMNRPEGRMTLRVLAPDMTYDSAAADFDEPRPANDLLAGTVILPYEAAIGTWAVEYTMNDEPMVRLEFDVTPATAESPPTNLDVGSQPSAEVGLKTADNLLVEGRGQQQR